MSTPCYGQSALFDSTEQADHLKARALCATCPALRACATTAATMPDAEGTWAGKLRGNIGALRRAAEDASFTDMEALAAHNRFASGDRDELTRAGNRVYERRRKTRRRRAA